MAYSIQPAELARVGRETAAERDGLAAVLDRIDPLLTQATDAARPSRPVAAELDRFLLEHRAAAGRVLARVDSALFHGEAAVAAYVRGDLEMVEQHGRAAGVLDGSRPLPPPVGGPVPVPELVTGG